MRFVWPSSRPLGLPLLLAGMLTTLGFAPFFLWPLALLGVAVLYRAVLAARGPRQAFVAALVWGIGHQLTALYWLPRAFYLDADRSVEAAVAGGVPALLGLGLYGAVAYALVAAGARAAPMRWRAAAFVGLWVAVEVLKSLHPMGFPWLPLGAVWGGSLPLMQSASIWGVHGLSLLVLAVALLLSRLQPWRWRTAAAVLLVLYTGGLARLAVAPATADGSTIRLVQPNIQSAHKWDARLRLEYLRQTLDVAYAPGRQDVQAIFMPETAVAFYLQEEDAVRGMVASGLVPGQSLVTGTVRRQTDTIPPRYYNSMVSMNAAGHFDGWYDKKLLVPFGEYIPFRKLIDALPLPAPVRVMSQSRLDYAFGTYDPHLPTAVGTGLALICYEGIFPYHVAKHAAGADYLINVTNDNWFTGTTALAQHATLERLRAVETGLPLVRVANTGITMVVDGYGRITASLPINTATLADVPLPPKLESTPWRQAVSRLYGFLHKT
ncbi:MAG: apolipoprotein N-acyltransferase [Pseudomonadaceae bacterium]|nr:apolipoprotein N-acyltransferase [Pseudomonadaceae bacterium]